MATVQEIQEEIFNEINNPENKIHLKVQKKLLDRDEYLNSIKARCQKAGLEDEETEDVLYLVNKALWGFGIIDDYINDPDISDIRLIDENTVRIKKKGKRLATPIKFASQMEYEKYIEFITNRNNTNMSIMNAAQVFTDKDTCESDILRFSLVSSLVNSNNRPTLLIRKIPKHKKNFDVLTDDRNDFCTKAQAEYLKKRWEDGHGMLICGPNGSGKTTLANAIIDSTPEEKSLMIIQESEELFCSGHPEAIPRKVIPQKNGSVMSYSLEDLTRLALMESIDVIVVGEIKGDEAAQLSYCTYTGAQAMTTVHSNSAAEGYEKIIDYALDAQPNRSREHFAKQIKSLDTAIFVKDYKVVEILELKNWNKQRGEYEFEPANINEG